MDKFYITAAIPYVNAKPHIGHALEFIQADTIARYRRLLGDEVLMLSGGDENALKNVQAAETAGIPIQKFVNQNNELFRVLAEKLQVQFDVWQKGSDVVHHYPASQKLWQLCADKGDIYKKKYEGLYCVGCEAFYAPDELNENGECYEHPGKKLERVEEENYFFRLSKYQQRLLELIETDALEIVPQSRRNEVLAFLRKGLVDLSISRSNQRAHNWGVPVPDDDSHRIYVWFDALNIYQSGIGFGWDEKQYQKWWPADLHVIGKGILRFHAVYWPAFLLSAGLALPKKILVHEYFTVNGQKMSKTVGNVYDPIPLVEKVGTDALRYYCLAKISPFKDGDFSEDKFWEAYTADLANGLGNLVARVAALAGRENFQFPIFNFQFTDTEFIELRKHLDVFRFDEGLKLIWEWVAELDQQIDEAKPWKLSGKELNKALAPLVQGIRKIGVALQPFLPETAEKILSQFKGPTIKAEKPLFPRV